VDPDWSAKTKRLLETMAPFVMLKVPEPLTPTSKLLSSCRLPAPETDTVPDSPAADPSVTTLVAALPEKICAVPPLLISAPLLELGTPVDQLAELNQLPVPSIQLVVCA
jgi:hypothetical protein